LIVQLHKTSDSFSVLRMSVNRGWMGTRAESQKRQIIDFFFSRFGKIPDQITRAPGRVNLLGEHVDYNDGFVMPAAIDRATFVAFSRAAGGDSTILALDFGEEISITPSSILSKRQADGKPLPEWGLYPAGVMKVLLDRGFEAGPFNAAFSSSVPRGSGLSSSASVEMAFMTAFCGLENWHFPLMDQALMCQKAENEYVGVNCGIMDQFASACGVENHLLLLDCRSLEWGTFPMPEDIAIIIADTRVRRKLTTGEYNQRRYECEEAVRLLRAVLPGINSLRDVSPQQLAQYSALLPAPVYRRARHVVEEIERTTLAQQYLRGGDIHGFAALLNECHISLRDLFEVSSPELNTMAEIAWSLDGCLGARLTGAGFGGCTVNLVEGSKKESFAEALGKAYREKTGITPEIYLTRASNGAGLID